MRPLTVVGFLARVPAIASEITLTLRPEEKLPVWATNTVIKTVDSGSPLPAGGI